MRHMQGCMGIMTAIGALTLSTHAAVGQSIQADTTGENNFTDSSFYGVEFLAGAGAVQSVTFDISVDADAFFDFDGGASYMDLTEPALDLGSLVGVSSGDITFVFDEPHSTFLTIQFAPGSFESGDSFRFAADTDNLVSDPAPGSVFGEAGATFTVTMEGGATSVGTFAVVSPTQSTVIPEFGGCLTILSQEVVCHADGTTFTFNAEGLNSCTGGTTQVTFTGDGGAVGEQICFTVLVNGGACCTTEICVTVPDCASPAQAGDLDHNGAVGTTDLLMLLNAWGGCSECDACPADFNGDCAVDALDMLSLLANWG